MSVCVFACVCFVCVFVSVCLCVCVCSQEIPLLECALCPGLSSLMALGAGR